MAHVPDWDDAADWYAEMLADPAKGYNELAALVALDLLGDVRDRDVLDLGCGEGHVSRRLARAGAYVFGVDPTARLVKLARQAERADPLGIRYALGRAEQLDGFGNQTFDAVCAVLVLHHADPLDAALSEARRVLRPGGPLVAVLPHPLLDHPGAGWLDGRRAVGRYTQERYWSTSDGGPVQAVHHVGWHHRTLATWFNALAANGFLIERVAEPLGWGDWRDLPRFLAVRCSR
ncbi:class I SAM-dependent methyltransferase [Dactylosporangium vinaceum]|uniref:Class I SAM-dependent methyltransferase n=1 Tax=Dactylosporangium vinaceum TaxID=53362 RepID=A0ABV5MKE6_9ACTN|nr:class I SAM-dependent methyltransferase [Dactylosporangium vinaceum]UAB94114.1 class I SAM-dependent methyltransferase [Dactylosporangium vinaceum]